MSPLAQFMRGKAPKRSPSPASGSLRDRVLGVLGEGPQTLVGLREALGLCLDDEEHLVAVLRELLWQDELVVPPRAPGGVWRLR